MFRKKKKFFFFLVYRPLLVAISVWIPGWSLGPFGVQIVHWLHFFALFSKSQKTQKTCFYPVNRPYRGPKRGPKKFPEKPVFRKKFLADFRNSRNVRARKHPILHTPFCGVVRRLHFLCFLCFACSHTHFTNFGILTFLTLFGYSPSL